MNGISERILFEVRKIVEYAQKEGPKRPFFSYLFSFLSKYVSNPRYQKSLFASFLIELFQSHIEEKTKEMLFEKIHHQVQSSSNLLDGFLIFFNYMNTKCTGSSISSFLINNSDKWNWSSIENPLILTISPYKNGIFDGIIFNAIFSNVPIQDIAKSDLINCKISSAFHSISETAQNNYADALLYRHKSDFFSVFEKIKASDERLALSIFRPRINYDILDECFTVTPENVEKYSSGIQIISRTFSQVLKFPDVFSAACLRGNREQLFSNDFLQFCFGRLHLDTFTGSFPYSLFASYPRYMELIDLKTFFAICQQTSISDQLFEKKIQQIPKTNEGIIEALCLLCKTPEKFWARMHYFFRMLISFSLQSYHIETVLKYCSTNYMSGIAHFLLFALKEHFVDDPNLFFTPLIIRTFIDEALNGNKESIEFLQYSLQVSEGNKLKEFWVNENVSDEILDVIEEKPHMKSIIQDLLL